jgi:glycosyltransferase involved in cell wall biosynthesis
MKVAFIAPEFLPNWGGVGSHIIELVKQLSKKIEVHVITPIRIVDNTTSYSEEETLRFFDNRIKLHYISKAENTFAYNLKFQYSVWKELPKLNREHRFDIIHSHFPHMSDILLKFGGNVIPAITTIHTTIEGQRNGILASDLDLLEMDVSERYTIFLHRLLTTVEKLYLRKSKNLLTVSHWMKDIIRIHYPFISGDVKVIHNGVDAEFFSPSRQGVFEEFNENGNPIVLFSSRLTAAKGAHYLIQAIPRILEKQDAHFVFVGAGSKEPWVRMLRHLNVRSDHFTFLGYQRYEDLPAIYSRASIYVAPTLYENLPIRILEAMSCGTPVVASNICAIPEAVNNGTNGLLVPPKDFETLASSILALLGDEGYRKKLGTAARKTIEERFTWQRIAMDTIKAYEKAVEA